MAPGGQISILHSTLHEWTLFTQSLVNLSNPYCVQGSVHNDSQQGCSVIACNSASLYVTALCIAKQPAWLRTRTWGILLATREASSHLSNSWERRCNPSCQPLPHGAWRTRSLPSRSWAWYLLPRYLKTCQEVRYWEQAIKPPSSS